MNAGSVALRTALTRAGWSGAEAARQLEASEATISRLCSGARKPGRSLAQAIESLLPEVSVELWDRDVEIVHSRTLTLRGRSRNGGPSAQRCKRVQSARKVAT